MLLDTIMKRSTRSTTALASSEGAGIRKATKTTSASYKTKLAQNSETVRRKSARNGDTPRRNVAIESIKSELHSHSPEGSSRSSREASERKETDEPRSHAAKDTLSDKKWKSWSKGAHSSPFPDFLRPSEAECRQSHRILEGLHGEAVCKNFVYTENPELYHPYVMDALVMATLSQAISWANAKRAMKSMGTMYGSPFAYQKILDGGEAKLVDANYY